MHVPRFSGEAHLRIQLTFCDCGRFGCFKVGCGAPFTLVPLTRQRRLACPCRRPSERLHVCVSLSFFRRSCRYLTNGLGIVHDSFCSKLVLTRSLRMCLYHVSRCSVAAHSKIRTVLRLERKDVKQEVLNFNVVTYTFSFVQPMQTCSAGH